MMGIVVPETCWAYKKYNKIISGIWLVFTLQLSQRCTVRTHQIQFDNPVNEKGVIKKMEIDAGVL